MADGRRNNGGYRPGAGRKPKSEKMKLIERLDNLINEDEVVEILKKKVRKGDLRALELYLKYRHGKPVDRKDIEVTGVAVDLSISKTYDGDKPESSDDSEADESDDAVDQDANEG